MEPLPHPVYVDSGVEWLGEMPEHWEVACLKFFSNVIDCKHVTAEFLDEGFPLASIGEVKNRYVDLATAKFTSQKFYNALIGGGRKPVENDIIYSRNATVGEAALVPADLPLFAMGQDVCLIRPKQTINSGFLIHVLKSELIYQQLDVKMIGSTFKRINVDDIRNFVITIPSIQDQIQIAKFLDHETAKIDRLVEKQQELIALLKEKRQAVISHAVTKGLNPNAPMKDSGVEWLGEVPEHWDIKNYRYATRIYRGKFGHRPRNDPSLYDGEFPFIQTGDIARADRKITKYSQTLNKKGADISEKFPAGTLVMAIAANIGDTAILEFEAYAPDSVVGFRPAQNVGLEFLRLSLTAALPALEKTSTQSTQANLNIERIGAVKAAFPPLEEQRLINSHINLLQRKYDKTQQACETAVYLLQERRTALISAAVTGKIDVRDWKPPKN